MKRWVGVTVIALVAGALGGAILTHGGSSSPTGGQVGVRLADTAISPSPGAPSAAVPSPSPVADASPSPGVPATAAPTQAPAQAQPSPAAPSPAPLPRPQYCGALEVLSPSTVTLATSTTKYECAYATLRPAGDIGPGSFPASGYVDFASGRYYVLAGGVLVRA